MPYFCHHFADLYIDLSVIYVVLSEKIITTRSLIPHSHCVSLPLTAIYLSIWYMTNRHNFLASQHNNLTFVVFSNNYIDQKLCQLNRLWDDVKSLCWLVGCNDDFSNNCVVISIALTGQEHYLLKMNKSRVNVNIWQDDIKIWQNNINIWKVMAEICHHNLL